MTDVSVVIPTRDRPALLAQALDTALAQKRVALEVIVVDDASSQAVAISDERVRVVRNESSSGPAHARNRGIAMAKGRWIAFLDDDDLWSPEKLASQIAVAAAVDAAFVYGQAVLFDEDRHTVVEDVPPPRPDALPKALIERNVIPAGSSNIVVQADLLGHTGGFDERLSQLADWDMWLRIAAAGQGSVCPEVVVGCRRHSANMLLADRRDVRDEFAYLAAKQRALSDELNVAFDPVAFSHWVATGQRRAGRRLAATRTHLEAAVRYRDAGHLGCALRLPLGDAAMDLRQPAAHEVAPPDWLRPHLTS